MQICARIARRSGQLSHPMIGCSYFSTSKVIPIKNMDNVTTAEVSIPSPGIFSRIGRLALSESMFYTMSLKKIYSDWKIAKGLSLESEKSYANLSFLLAHKQNISRLPVFSIFLIVPMWLMPVFLIYFPSSLPYAMLKEGQRDALFKSGLPHVNKDGQEFLHRYLEYGKNVPLKLAKWGITGANICTNFPQSFKSSLIDEYGIKDLKKVFHTGGITVNQMRNNLSEYINDIRSIDFELAKDLKKYHFSDSSLLQLCWNRGLIWQHTPSHTIDKSLRDSMSWNRQSELSPENRRNIESRLEDWLSLSLDKEVSEVELAAFSILTQHHGIISNESSKFYSH